MTSIKVYLLYDSQKVSGEFCIFTPLPKSLLLLSSINYCNTEIHILLSKGTNDSYCFFLHLVLLTKHGN